MTKEEIRQWLVSYGMPLPTEIFPQQPSTSISGASGATSNATTHATSSAPSPASGASGASGVVAHLGSPDGTPQEEECANGIPPAVGDWVNILSADGTLQYLVP